MISLHHLFDRLGMYGETYVWGDRAMAVIMVSKSGMV